LDGRNGEAFLSLDYIVPQAGRKQDRPPGRPRAYPPTGRPPVGSRPLGKQDSGRDSALPLRGSFGGWPSRGWLSAWQTVRGLA